MPSIDIIQEFHNTSSNTLSGSVTGAANNTCLVVFIVFDSTLVDLVTSITYGGQNLAIINGHGNTGGFGGWIDTWVLFNPPTGTQTLTANLSSSVGHLSMVAVSLKGTYQGIGSNGIGNNFATGFNSAGGAQGLSIATVRPNSIAIMGWFGALNPGGLTTHTGTMTNQFGVNTNSNWSDEIDNQIPSVPTNCTDGWTTLVGNVYQVAGIEIFAPGSSSSDTLFYGA
jgi:hypothetical protein